MSRTPLLQLQERLFSTLYRTILILVFIILNSLNVSISQTTNDYRTNSTNGNWSTASHWQTWNGSSWVTAFSSPTNTNAQAISIRSGHTMTVSTGLTADQVVVDGILIINPGITITISNFGTQLTVNGTLSNRGTIVKGSSASIVFNSGSIYIHDQNGGTIPTATWAASSTCRITGLTNTDPTGDGQYFGNLVYDCPNIYYTTGNPNTFDGSFSIQGNFEVVNTGANTLYLTVPDAGTLNVGGDLIIKDDFSLGGGVSYTRTINVAGNFTQTSGIFTRTNTANSYVNFNGTGTQMFTFSGGTITDNISFSVISGSTLQMGTEANPSVIPGTCSGSFTLYSGAALIITSTQGITTSGASGNIQVTGVRSYSTGANYIYSGSSSQITGSGLPTSAITGSVTIQNTLGVTPTFNLNISGTLTVNGLLTPTASQIISGSGTLNGTGIVYVTRTTTGSANFNNQYTILTKSISGLTLSYQGSAVQTISDPSIGNLLMNNASGVSLTGNLTVNGNLTLTSGKITLGSNNLVITGSVTGGSSSSYIITNGTGTLTRNSVGSGIDVLFPVGISSSYNPVSINNSGTTDNFSVRVKNTFDNLPPDTSRVVKRQWIVNETTPGGSIAKLTFQFNSGEWGNSFSTINPVHVGKWNGSAWIGYYATLSGSGPFAVSNNISDPVTSFSPFGVGNEGALPVEISSFLSRVENRNVLLRWQTEWEINNSGFDIERRMVTENGNTSWTKIGFTPGSGTTNQQMQYSFEDADLKAGSYQYRLKQIDYNGNFEYFPLESEIIIDPPRNFSMSQNYPNPSNPKSKIDYELPVDGNVTIKLYDITGSEVATIVNEIKPAGYYFAELDGTNLASGIYFYKLSTGKYEMTKRMVLVK